MGHLTTYRWDTLFDSPALVATLDALPGYVYPEAARRELCAQYGLAEADFEAMRKLHAKWRKPGHQTRRARDGWDLLLEYPKLCRLLDEERDAPRLGASLIERRREAFRLSRAEMVNVLNAHADVWSRA